jgi:GNAT superfamily N-acetyltransferase
LLALVSFNMKLGFALLAEMPEVVPVVAGWLFDEWGHERPGSSVESIAEDIRSKLDPASLPIQLLALRAERPVGVAMLKPHEMKDIFPERTPWLGSLVVAPAHRRNGIGAALTREIEELARSRGFARLYLQTERADGGVYARLGWAVCDRLPYRGYQANVMTKQLFPRASGQV